LGHCSSQAVERVVKGEEIPLSSLDRSRGFQEIEAPKFQDSGHLKVVRLSYAPATLAPQVTFLVIISFRGRVNPRAVVRM